MHLWNHFWWANFLVEKGGMEEVNYQIRDLDEVQNTIDFGQTEEAALNNTSLQYKELFHKIIYDECKACTGKQWPVIHCNALREE